MQDKSSLMNNFSTKGWFTFIISILLLTNLAILLNIPFLRQILGFLFLTILPGLLVLQIIKLNKLGYIEKVVLSVGVSISFLMFFGLLINNLALSLGYETPLSTFFLLIVFNLAFILLAIVGYKINNNPIFSLPNLHLTSSEKAFLIVPILFPALSMFGMHVMNTTDNNIILMFLLYLIPIYVIFVCIFNHKFPKRLYPVIIFLISISLLLLLSLRSNHIIGDDAHEEFYIFQMIATNLYWSILGYNPLDACLSISILPTIYQSILNINPEFLFKILYSLIYSISPLVIYVISKKYLEEGYAFLASCFFMFQICFLFTAMNARTSTAVLFITLAMMTLFNDKIEPLKKRILFIVFMASCTVSHYATTYIFFFVMTGTFIGIEALSKKYTVKKVISLTLVVLFFSMIFFWYSQVTETAFNYGVGFIETTIQNLNNFFTEEVRSVQGVFGKDIMQKGIPHKIEFVFTWLTFALIGIGLVTLITKYKEMSFPEQNFKKPEFLKEKFEVEYFLITLACFGLLVVIVVLPYVSTSYGMQRLYAVVITILSPFFVIGGIMLSKHFFFFTKRKSVLKEKQKSLIKKFSFKKKSFTKRSHSLRNNRKDASEVRAYLIILLVLIPYFLCATGVSYSVFGYPRRIILDCEGDTYDLMYVHDQESYGAKWLKSYAKKDQEIYTDYFGQRRLLSQGEISPSIINYYWLSRPDKIVVGYIYLRYQNIVAGKLAAYEYSTERYNMTEYADILTEKNEIYDSGCSKMYG